MIMSLRYYFLVLFIVLLMGCSSTRSTLPDTRYYTLEYTTPQVNGSTMPVVVSIHRFGVAPEFNTSKMIYRDLSFGRQEYNYHRWRATPQVLVMDYLRRDMLSTGLFLAVNGPGSSLRADYLVEGIVEEWMEVDEDEGWLAAAELTITLIDLQTQKIPDLVLFQRQFKESEPCLKKNPDSVAAAMSRVMQRLAQRIITDIHQTIAEHQD